ncbi:MAG: peptidoglycan DD-metalloendopeptidase family protein [Bacteroidales bacterium]|nr:peptidoglycan DD-metalloendopeptidase family protein [Bacteroidales bacterium]MDD4669883.1 peptidoglycan DD-metalloendopeptidase family protein [Bacteroidales bacterium]
MEKKLKRGIILGSITALIAILGLILYFVIPEKGEIIDKEEISEGVKDENIYEYGIPINKYDIQEGIVKRGDFFSTILNKMGISQKEIYDISQISQSVFDVKNIQIGNSYHAYFTKEEQPRLAYWVYEKNDMSMVIYQLIDTVKVSVLDKEVVTTTKYVEVTIQSSLWEDTQKAGVTPLLAIKLSDIYAWSIDFFGLQKGDSFSAVYNEVTCEGKIMDVNEVYYSVFKNSGKEYKCFYFEEEGTVNRYWNEKGESMRKSFLKAPLKYFSRISSGFSYARRHPITRIVRPHTGIDYAAPKGTPVMSIGDGVVVEKGYKGGGGNTVKIKHNSVYTSAYLHLSKYGAGIKAGSRVSQGQIIGYVGSTGASTGPHLDFRIWKNGTPINPLKMESPPAEPISQAHLQQFEQQKRQAAEQASRLQISEIYHEMILAPLGDSI